MKIEFDVVRYYPLLTCRHISSNTTGHHFAVGAEANVQSLNWKLLKPSKAHDMTIHRKFLFQLNLGSEKNGELQGMHKFA